MTMLGALKKIGCITVAAALLMTALPQAEPLPFVNALAAGYFLDIDGHPSQAVIERWASLGVAWGHNGYFYPDDHVTRAEFFTIANRTFGASLTAPINQYRDVPDTAWYYEEIMRSFAAGYVQGTSSTTMDPNSRITREEVVTLLAQIVGLYAPNAAGLSDMYDDADQIAGYARGFITAFTEKGWISAG
ncbi:MAG: S-layer homology domain-containing protein, partial [Oscillospiraceae bacterium]|nr:S-layer homology domain-containing protein [Oscillospiraceae bacterium]